MANLPPPLEHFVSVKTRKKKITWEIDEIRKMIDPQVTKTQVSKLSFNVADQDGEPLACSLSLEQFLVPGNKKMLQIFVNSNFGEELSVIASLELWAGTKKIWSRKADSDYGSCSIYFDPIYDQAFEGLRDSGDETPVLIFEVELSSGTENYVAVSAKGLERMK